MVSGPKTTLFHGCSDGVVNAIWKGGFDDNYACSFGAFGPGLYFSPQACKSFQYATNYMFICEVALGSEENRLTMTTSDSSLSYQRVFQQQGKRSVQCHTGAPFNHEERIVYRSTQCKVVYIVDLTGLSTEI